MLAQPLVGANHIRAPCCRGDPVCPHPDIHRSNPSTGALTGGETIGPRFIPNKNGGVVDVTLSNLQGFWFQGHASEKRTRVAETPVSPISIDARALYKTPILLHLLNLNVTSVLSHTDSSLPPESERQPQDPVKDTPGDLGGEFVAVNRVRLHAATQRESKVTYASNCGPKVVGMKRGAWKRIVDTVV